MPIYERLRQAADDDFIATGKWITKQKVTRREFLELVKEFQRDRIFYTVTNDSPVALTFDNRIKVYTDNP
jgi:hypothetical protein